MKALVALALSLALGLPAAAQTPPRQIDMGGDRWGYYFLDYGMPPNPMLGGGVERSEAIITIMSRNGRALTEADRSAAWAVARFLCEDTGRVFNTQARGHFIANGGLGFHGACLPW